MYTSPNTHSKIGNFIMTGLSYSRCGYIRFGTPPALPPKNVLHVLNTDYQEMCTLDILKIPPTLIPLPEHRSRAPLQAPVLAPKERKKRIETTAPEARVEFSVVRRSVASRLIRTGPRPAQPPGHPSHSLRHSSHHEAEAGPRAPGPCETALRR